MPSSNKVYTVTEYSGFTRNVHADGYQMLPSHIFDALENLILVNRLPSGGEIIDLLAITARRGIGKVITARNYVGVITLSDGTTIEILPKIAGNGVSLRETKKIFLDMLKTLREVNFKESTRSSLETDRLNMLELFIRLFLEEVMVLIKQGLRGTYALKDSNERYYKGKLLVPPHIKNNGIIRDHFYVEFDEFNLNRPEHRVIKGTLKRLLKFTGDMNNRQTTAQLLSWFDVVPDMVNPESDLSMCHPNRSTLHYERVLAWCRIFLKGNSFTSFSGREEALAILFPMERVFESFVATKIRHLVGSEVSVREQDSRFSLFDSPCKTFALRPDVVLERKGQSVILDTKWKLLTDQMSYSGISQSDMYQMYAYSKKYQPEKIILIYPWSDQVSAKSIQFDSDDGAHVEAQFLDLRTPEESLSKILMSCAPTVELLSWRR